MAAYRRQNEALQAAYDPLLTAALPARLQPGTRRWWRPLQLPLQHYAVAAALMAVSGMAGWQ